MDYITRPTSKKALRIMARELRTYCEVPQHGPFPTLFILDRLRDLFPGSNYDLLPDDKFPKKTMARCKPNNRGGYTIEIRESVYDRARHERGPDLGFICHEICHIFLFSKGFTPIFERSLKTRSIHAYRSVEWQAKYLCGEVMIPYKESIGMSMQKIIDYYHVSKSYAKSRIEMN